MKKLCCIISALLISVTVFAQAERGHVYLKNGTILKGKYRWIDDSRKLQVETAAIYGYLATRRLKGLLAGVGSMYMRHLLSL
jgi:hypothetical protein